jgi:hypothetical protein
MKQLPLKIYIEHVDEAENSETWKDGADEGPDDDSITECPADVKALLGFDPFSEG